MAVRFAFEETGLETTVSRLLELYEFEGDQSTRVVVSNEEGYIHLTPLKVEDRLRTSVERMKYKGRRSNDLSDDGNLMESGAQLMELRYAEGGIKKNQFVLEFTQAGSRYRLFLPVNDTPETPRAAYGMIENTIPPERRPPITAPILDVERFVGSGDELAVTLYSRNLAGLTFHGNQYKISFVGDGWFQRTMPTSR